MIEDVERAVHGLTAGQEVAGSVAALDDLPMELGKDKCSLPADGSATASISVAVDEDAAGNPILVGIAPAGVAELLGVHNGRIVLAKEPNGDRASATFAIRGNSMVDAAVTVSASVTKLSEPILIAARPTFTGPEEGGIVAGATQMVSLETTDRVERCSATVSGTPAGTVTGTVSDLDDSSFIGRTFVFSEAAERACGGLWGLSLGFAEDAVVGGQLRVTCEDTHGQSRTLNVPVRRPPSETDGTGGAAN